MKILRVRFKNLNSLKGEWNIDFTHPAYTTEGIMVISGPTGAGKTTILDAVCLALYGKTPRLSKITKSSNDIMSRHTADCFSEVLFETQKGLFLCHWSQQRAQRNGDLRNPKHEIVDAATKKVLETKKRSVASTIESVTGMDFGRFTRSMMLAQGGFAAFLNAKPDERSPILEQITGTEIYSQISIKVHEQKVRETEKLKQMQSIAENFEYIGKDKEKELEEELEERLKSANKIEESAEIINKKLSRIQSFYTKLEELEEKQNLEKDGLIDAQKIFPEIEQKSKQAFDKLDLYRQKLEQIRLDRKSQLEVIKKVRELDIDIKNKKESIDQIALSIDKESKRILEIEEIINQNYIKYVETLSYIKEEEPIKRVADISPKRKELLKFLETKEKEKQAVENEISIFLDGVDVQSLRDNLDMLKEKRGIIEKILETVKIIDKNCDSVKNLDKLKAKYALLATDLEKDIGEKIQIKDRLEKDADNLEIRAALLNKIKSLEEERKQLKDNKPCPLCGSLDHPYAAGNIPKIDHTQIELKKVKEDLKNLVSQISELKVKQAETLKDIEKADIDIQEKNAGIKEDNKSLAELCSKISIQQTKESAEYILYLEEEKKKIEAKIETQADVLNSVINLEQRLKKVSASLERAKDFFNQAELIKAETGKHRAALNEIKKGIEEKKDSKKELMEKLCIIENSRKKIYTDKDPDKEEKKIEDAFATAEKDVESAKADLDLARQTLAELKNKIESLKESIEKRDKKTKEVKEALCFETQGADGQSEEELHAELEDFKAKIKENQEKIGAIRQTLIKNKEMRNKHIDMLKEIDKQGREVDRWRDLHDLIGSADGKKYRNFAQGLTFDIMISHANSILKDMTDRYLLLRDDFQPLELNVIDSYQAGEIRCAKNLSGGESFIVSLALALGLSSMASQKVRVDSLFLDEGFGTLDEDALETALDTLSSISREGKLIGVISHIESLKERINTQIQVIPKTGGVSEIIGPGCSNL